MRWQTAVFVYPDTFFHLPNRVSYGGGRSPDTNTLALHIVSEVSSKGARSIVRKPSHLEMEFIPLVVQVTCDLVIADIHPSPLSTENTLGA